MDPWVTRQMRDMGLSSAPRARRRLRLPTSDAPSARVTLGPDGEWVPAAAAEVAARMDGRDVHALDRHGVEVRGRFDAATRTVAAGRDREAVPVRQVWLSARRGP